MSTLTGKKLDETYHSLLKVGDNSDLSSTPQYIVDAQGNSSGVQLSTSGDLLATGAITAAGFIGDLTGNADTATKWLTARTITIGDTGKSVDGTANVTWSKAEIGYDLQDVTDNGSTTTNSITASYFIGDGSLLTNLPNGGSLTLQDVTTNGNTTTQDVGIGLLTTETPSSRLHIKSPSTGTIDDVVRWTDAVTDTGYLGIDSTGGIKVWAGGFLSFGAGGGGSFIERMRIDSSGNVGIGTNSPTDKLQIDAPNSQLRLRDTDDGTYTQISSSGNLLAIRQNSTTASHFWMNSSGNVGLGTNSPQDKLHVAGNAIVDGSLQVGSLVYQQSYYVNDESVGWHTIAVNSGNRAIARFGIRDTDGGDHQSIVFYASHHYGAHSDITILHSGRYSGTPLRYIRIKEGGTYDGALLQVYVDHTSNSLTAYLLGDDFQDSGWTLVNWVPDGTNPGGVGNFSALTNVAVQVDIDKVIDGGMLASGNIVCEGRMAVNSPIQSAILSLKSGDGYSGVEAMFVQGVSFNTAVNISYPYACPAFTLRSELSTGTAIYFYTSNTNSCGSISVSGTTTSYNTSSDYRLKENLAPINDGINRLKLLEPKRFNFISEPNKTVDGFVAHEVQEVVPEAVTGEKDGVDWKGEPEYQGIDQAKLVPLLTAALQEAVAKIEALEERITILESN